VGVVPGRGAEYPEGFPLWDNKIIRIIRMIFNSNSVKWIFEKVPGSGSAGSVAILALEDLGSGGLKNDFRITFFPWVK
jgi:hypothetical protein